MQAPSLHVRRSTLYANIAAALIASCFLGVKWDVGPIVLRPFDGFLAVAVIVLLAPLIARGRIPRISFHPALIVFLILNVYVFGNAIVLSGLTAAVKEGVQILEFLFLYIIIVSSLREPHSQKGFIIAITVLFWILVIWTVSYHFSQGIYFRFKELNEPKYLFGIVAALSVAAFVGSKRRGGLAVSAALIISIIVTLFSGERKAWFAFAAAGAAILFLGYIRPLDRRTFARMLTFGALGSLLLAGVFVAAQENQYVRKQFDSLTYWMDVVAGNAAITEESTQSNELRRGIIEVGVTAFLEKPIFGIGTDNFEEYMKQTIYASESKKPQGAHNEYLRYAAENGVIGLGLYLLTWCLMFIELFLISRHAFKFNADQWAFAAFGAVIVTYAATISFFMSAGAAAMALIIISLSVIDVARRFYLRKAHAPIDVPAGMSVVGSQYQRV